MTLYKASGTCFIMYLFMVLLAFFVLIFCTWEIKSRLRPWTVPLLLVPVYELLTKAVFWLSQGVTVWTVSLSPHHTAPIYESEKSTYNRELPAEVNISSFSDQQLLSLQCPCLFSGSSLLLNLDVNELRSMNVSVWSWDESCSAALEGFPLRVFSLVFWVWLFEKHGIKFYLHPSLWKKALLFLPLHKNVNRNRIHWFVQN